MGLGCPQPRRAQRPDREGLGCCSLAEGQRGSAGCGGRGDSDTGADGARQGQNSPLMQVEKRGGTSPPAGAGTGTAAVSRGTPGIPRLSLHNKHKREGRTRVAGAAPARLAPSLGRGAARPHRQEPSPWCHGCAAAPRGQQQSAWAAAEKKSSGSSPRSPSRSSAQRRRNAGVLLVHRRAISSTYQGRDGTRLSGATGKGTRRPAPGPVSRRTRRVRLTRVAAVSSRCLISPGPGAPRVQGEAPRSLLRAARP